MGSIKGKKKTEQHKENMKKAWTVERKEAARKRALINNPMFKQSAIDKIKETSFKKYGVSNFFKTNEFKKFISENNAMNDPKNIAKIKESKLKNHGDANYCNPKKIRQTFQKRYGVNNAQQIKEVKERTIDTYTKRLAAGEYSISNNRWKTGWYTKIDGTKEWYDSSFEQKRMQQLDSLGLSWTKRHHIRIPYIYNNIHTYYVPDFLIDGNIIEEVKGWMNIQVKAKIKAAKKYCKKHNYTYRLLLGQELKEYDI